MSSRESNFPPQYQNDCDTSHINIPTSLWSNTPFTHIDNNTSHDNTYSIINELHYQIDYFLSSQRLIFTTASPNPNKLFFNLKLSIHNINGLKSRHSKLLHLVEYMKKDNIDMMALNKQIWILKTENLQ
jgi:hypothetical protein